MRHQYDTTLPEGAGWAAVVQLDSPSGAKITQAYGLRVYKPEKFRGGAVGDYYGVRVYGATDAIGDALATGLAPRRWYGVYVGRGVNTGDFDSKTRAIHAEGRSEFIGPGSGGMLVTFGLEPDAAARNVIADDGSIQMGGGAVAVDTFIQRRAPKVIETSGTVFRTGNVATANAPSAST